MTSTTAATTTTSANNSPTTSVSAADHGSSEASDADFSIDSLSSSAGEDAYSACFAKQLSASAYLNSTLLLPSGEDFCGGLVNSPARSSASVTTTSVSAHPSDSSFGFQNTYALLERQLSSKGSAARQLREFLQYNDRYKTPVFCDATPLSAASRGLSANYLRSITEESESLSSRRSSATTAATVTDDEDEKPSFLELELEASSRLRKLRERLGGSTSSIDTTDDAKKLESPMVEALYGITADSLEQVAASARTHPNPEVFLPAGTADDDDKTSQSGEYPEYIYHVAKGNDGRMYLKVVRSLLLDKVLCGNRVSQMTRAYDDIDAVTRLLEEKEKDLELTVQIGKELLTQNTHLESRVAELEQELKNTNENLSQLAHELHQKNELIGILTNDVDDSGSENVTPTTSKSINLELLQRKVKSLEDENKSLRNEAAQLVQETDEVEEQERRLMADIANQLNTANSEYDGLNLELERLKEENRLQHENIISLTSRLTEAEIRLHQLTTENEEASSLLSITKENQNLLAGELAEFKARYQEVLNLLHETQEQLRKQRKRSAPMARSSLIPGMGGVPAVDSLQSELMETSLYSEHSLDSGIASERCGPSSHMASYKKVFETVRSATRANTTGFSDGYSQLGSMTMSSSSQPRMAPYVFPGATGGTTTTHSYKSGSSIYSTMYESSLGGRSFSRESLVSESEDGYPGPAQAGIPGAPGAKDLEAALKRLTPAEVLARRAMLQHAPAGTYSYDDQPSRIPLGCRTPDSIMSTGSSGLSGMSSTQWRLPEKLQIVKPIEGSQTLHHWSRLATPTLSGLLEERPGVTIRGGRGLEDLGLQTYSLSDVEEDAEEHPGKRFQSFGCTYTFTNSTVMHPDDGTTAVTFSLPPSQISSQMASEAPSRQPSAPSTPRSGLSRRNSCSTFSVNLGLASMLNERGIKAVTPSALNTPAGANFSPTITPCNSPEGSPTRSMSPEPPLLSGLLASGADILRKKFAVASSSGAGTEMERPSRLTARNKLALTRLEKKALRSIKIMEKVESMGVDNFMHHGGHGISPLALHGSSALYTSTVRGRTSSPMAQLTSLKHLQDNSRMKQQHHQQQQQDELLIDKETIKKVLSKGLSHEGLKHISSGSSDASGASSSSSSSSTSGVYPDSESGSSVAGAKAKPAKQETTTAAATSASAARLKQMQRQKSRRSLLNGANGSQRPDLGTVNGSSRPGVRPDLGTVGGSTSNKTKSNSKATDAAAPAPVPEQARSLGQSVYGTISSLLFGRKGGLL